MGLLDVLVWPWAPVVRLVGRAAVKIRSTGIIMTKGVGVRFPASELRASGVGYEPARALNSFIRHYGVVGLQLFFQKFWLRRTTKLIDQFIFPFLRFFGVAERQKQFVQLRIAFQGLQRIDNLRISRRLFHILISRLQF